MKAFSIEKMMDWLEPRTGYVGTTSDFYGHAEESENDGIWISAEDGKENSKGQQYFDYWAQSKNYECGVLKSLREQAQKRGWYFEWNDPGTVMLYPINC